MNDNMFFDYSLSDGYTGEYFEQYHPGDAGYDLRFFDTSKDSVTIPPHTTVRVKTGIRLQIPNGYVGIIKDRSSTALRNLECKAGVIDSGYRGEVILIMYNRSPCEPQTLRIHDRVAQIVILPCLTLSPRYKESLDETARGEKGFGSTGIKE